MILCHMCIEHYARRMVNLCIIESKKVRTYEFFVKCLSAYKVTHALYLDMGRGWNYAWYRDKDGKVKDVFPESMLTKCQTHCEMEQTRDMNENSVKLV